jgi:hypothetical protein
MNGLKYNQKRAYERFEKILDIIEDRLDQLGPIRLADAWKLCGDSGMSYTVVAQYFERIMALMIEQGKAQKKCKGVYIILKPNRKLQPMLEAVEAEPAKPLEETLEYLKEKIAG